jgi:hypothetical protein
MVLPTNQPERPTKLEGPRVLVLISLISESFWDYVLENLLVLLLTKCRLAGSIISVVAANQEMACRG